MTTLASFEAKSHFSEMIERASNGEEIVITKRGRPVAKVVPYMKKSGEEIEDFLATLADFRASQKSSKGPSLLKDGETWRDLAHEGH